VFSIQFGRGSFDVPVTNLKGLVSRSLSDILAVGYRGWVTDGSGKLNGLELAGPDGKFDVRSRGIAWVRRSLSEFVDDEASGVGRFWACVVPGSSSQLVLCTN